MYYYKSYVRIFADEMKDTTTHTVTITETTKGRPALPFKAFPFSIRHVWSKWLSDTVFYFLFLYLCFLDLLYHHPFKCFSFSTSSFPSAPSFILPFAFSSFSLIGLHGNRAEEYTRRCWQTGNWTSYTTDFGWLALRIANEWYHKGLLGSLSESFGACWGHSTEVFVLSHSVGCLFFISASVSFG